MTIDGAKSTGGQVYADARAKLLEEREREHVAAGEAENAYASVRMLIPAAADEARRYLDLCCQADVHTDSAAVKRQQARQAVEEKFRQTFGADFNWVFVQPHPRSRRAWWWKIPLAVAVGLGLAGLGWHVGNFGLALP